MKSLFNLFSILLLSIIFFGCGSSKNMTVEKGAIAPDFPDFQGTLLIRKSTLYNDNVINRKLDKNFKQYYGGSYVLIDYSDLKSAYNDIDKFRFVIGLELEISGTSGMGRFKMFDRKTQREYFTKWHDKYYFVIQHYAQALGKYHNKK